MMISFKYYQKYLYHEQLSIKLWYSIEIKKKEEIK